MFDCWRENRETDGAEGIPVDLGRTLLNIPGLVWTVEIELSGILRIAASPYRKLYSA